MFVPKRNELLHINQARNTQIEHIIGVHMDIEQ